MQAQTLAYNQEMLDSMHAIQLAMLKVIDRICKQYNITWFLEGGTALGAMRHQGFIPWDDDVDVAMMRQDYDTFVKIAPRELPSNMRLDTPENNPNLPAPFAKIIRTDTVFQTRETAAANYDMGIFVDIFCYDRLSNNRKTRLQQRRKAKRVVWGKYLYVTGDIIVPGTGILGAMQKLACRVAHPLIRTLYSEPRLNEELKRSVLLGNPELDSIRNEDSIYLSGWPYLEYNAADFLPTRLEQFEGCLFPVPGNVEAYLTHLYGNWRNLPSPEQRKSHQPLKLVLPV